MALPAHAASAAAAADSLGLLPGVLPPPVVAAAAAAAHSLELLSVVPLATSGMPHGPLKALLAM